jgi:hypothetical protein
VTWLGVVLIVLGVLGLGLGILLLLVEHVLGQKYGGLMLFLTGPNLSPQRQEAARRDRSLALVWTITPLALIALGICLL